MSDITSKITQVEAGRLKTELEKIGERVKYRFLIGYSPKEIADMLTAKVKAEDVAKMAGRA